MWGVGFLRSPQILSTYQPLSLHKSSKSPFPYTVLPRPELLLLFPLAHPVVRVHLLSKRQDVAAVGSRFVVNHRSVLVSQVCELRVLVHKRQLGASGWPVALLR